MSSETQSGGSTDGSGGKKQPVRTRYVTIITPHVLRFRRPASCSGGAAAGTSLSPSPPLPGQPRLVSLRRLSPAEPISTAPQTAAASPLPAATAESAINDCTHYPQDCHLSPAAAAMSVNRPEELCWADAAAETSHLSMGCDVMEVLSEEPQPFQEVVSVSEVSAAEPAASLEDVDMTLVEEAAAAVATPQPGSQVLSSADIPLQDEYVIDDLIGQSAVVYDYESYLEPDGETMARVLFGYCDANSDSPVQPGAVPSGDGVSGGGGPSEGPDGSGSGDGPGGGVSGGDGPDGGGGGDGPWNAQTPAESDCARYLSWSAAAAAAAAALPEAAPELPASLDAELFSSQQVWSQSTTPGCRCALASSYNKKQLLDQHLDVRILPADPRAAPAAPDERAGPASKASVAIQQLLSSVVPPQLYGESQQPTAAWSQSSSETAATAASGGTQASPQAAGADQGVFLPEVGPAEQTPDPALLPDGPVVVLGSDYVVQFEDPAACVAGGGGGGPTRVRRARGSGRRNMRLAGDTGERRTARGRGRGRRGRRGARRGRGSRANEEPDGDDPWLSQTAAARRGAGGGPAGADESECRLPCNHFRRVVVGLSDLGPEPLAPTEKYQLWRRLSGTPEMLDVCRCLDLSYLTLRLATGELRYRCNICHKEFKLESSVRRHHRMVHDDERRYTCAECAASYFQLSDLKRHLLASHTDLKPFLCRHCGEQFARDTDYRKHIDQLHW